MIAVIPIVVLAQAFVAAEPVEDFDKDGVPDLEDDCPTDPGDKKAKGCPGKVEPPAKPRDPPKVEVQKDHIELGETVEFRTGSASVHPDSFALIAEIAKAVASLPAEKKILVEGHTDNRGNAKANVALSEKRAQAVIAHLVRAGVARDRLKALGSGPNKPIASNASDEGRKKNRRVEIHIVD